jgi:hypothetical protein
MDKFARDDASRIVADDANLPVVTEGCAHAASAGAANAPLGSVHMSIALAGHHVKSASRHRQGRWIDRSYDELNAWLGTRHDDSKRGRMNHSYHTTHHEMVSSERAWPVGWATTGSRMRHSPINLRPHFSGTLLSVGRGAGREAPRGHGIEGQRRRVLRDFPVCRRDPTRRLLKSSHRRGR